MKNYIVTGIVALLLVISVVQAFQISKIKNEITGNSMVSASGDTSGGETYEQMMARMHPDQVATKPSSGGPAQVGGC